MLDDMGRCEGCGKITPEGDLEVVFEDIPDGDPGELWCKECRDEAQ